jgi:Domain of unknown function (DUF4783)
MKQIFTILAFTLSFAVAVAKEGNDDGGKKKKADNELADRIKISFRSGNSRMLASCLNREVELVIDSEKIDFSKISTDQAEQVLKTFFQKNPPMNFQYVYQGSSNSEVRYSVANFRSRNKDYLVYILIKRAGVNKYVVDTIQFREG